MSFKRDLKLISSTDGSRKDATLPVDPEQLLRERGLQHLWGEEQGYAVQLGAVRRARSELRSHTLLVGDTGSGKNLIGDPYLAAHLINRRAKDKFLLFDPKGNIQGLLAGLDIPYTLVSIDDERGVAIDIIKDCTSPTVMLGYAKALFPDRKGGDEFWRHFARSIAIAVKNTMVDINYRAPFLATFVRVLKEIHYLATQETNSEGEVEKTTPTPFYQTFISHSPLNRMLVEVLTSSDSIEAGVLGEILSATERLTPAAAHDAKAKHRVSIADFVKGEAKDQEGNPIRVLVFNMDIRSRESSESYMRLAFRMFIDSLIALPDCVKDPDHSKIHVVIDELPFVSSSGLPGFQEGLSVGRSKGAHFLAIIQSIPQILDVFGPKTGLAILYSLPDKIFTATTASDNGKFFEEACGKLYKREAQTNPAFGKDGVSFNTSNNETLRTQHPSGELLSLLFPSRTKGLHFYHLDPDFKDNGGPIRGHWSGELVDELMPPHDKSVPGLIPRPPEYFYLPELPELEREWLAHGICEPFYNQVIRALQSKDATPLPAPSSPGAATDAGEGEGRGGGKTLAPFSEELEAIAAQAATGGELSGLSQMRTDSYSVVLAEYQRLVDEYLTKTYGTKGY